MRFKITWKDGRTEEVEQSDCNTVEQFISCRFGSAGTREASVAIVGETHKSAPKKIVKPASDGAVTREE